MYFLISAQHKKRSRSFVGKKVAVVVITADLMPFMIIFLVCWLVMTDEEKRRYAKFLFINLALVTIFLSLSFQYSILIQARFSYMSKFPFTLRNLKIYD